MELTFKDNKFVYIKPDGRETASFTIEQISKRKGGMLNLINALQAEIDKIDNAAFAADIKLIEQTPIKPVTGEIG
jgi:hypothetical protein